MNDKGDKMDKKVIFFDADGTIINGNYMAPRVKEMLQELERQGHILVLSTGRALPAMGKALQAMNFENIICSGGNVTLAENNVIFNHALTVEELKEIRAFLDEREIPYHMEAPDYIWIKKGEMQNYIDRYKRLFPAKEDLTKEESEEAKKMLEETAARSKEEENIHDLAVNKIHYFSEELSFEELKERFGEQFHCVPLSLSNQFSGGEISTKGVTKRIGMEKILDYFDMPLESTVAVGDDFNDIEMLEYAPYSIVLEHAHDEVKKYADHVTEDFDNDGFYHAMVHLGLL